MDATAEEMGAGPGAAALDRLPHRPPFRFVSEIRHLEEGREGIGTWSVTGDEWFFAGHFPANPVVPGVLIIEALAQLSGLVGLHIGGRGPASDSGCMGRTGRLVHTDVRFDGGVAPPMVIELRSTMSKSLGSLRQFEVSATAGGVMVAKGSLVLAEVG